MNKFSSIRLFNLTISNVCFFFIINYHWLITDFLQFIFKFVVIIISALGCDFAFYPFLAILFTICLGKWIQMNWQHIWLIKIIIILKLNIIIKFSILSLILINFQMFEYFKRILYLNFQWITRIFIPIFNTNTIYYYRLYKTIEINDCACYIFIKLQSHYSLLQLYEI